MDTVRAILFENPFYLVPILLIGMAILLRVWSTRRTPATARLVWVGLLLCVGAIVLQDFIKTDREKVIASCTQLIDSAEAGDIPGIAEELSPGFLSEGMNKDEILEQITKALTMAKITNAKPRQFDTVFETPNVIRLSFTCSATVSTPSWGGQPTVSRWQMWFERTGDTWKVIRFQPVRTPLFPVANLRDLISGSY